MGTHQIQNPNIQKELTIQIQEKLATDLNLLLVWH